MKVAAFWENPENVLSTFQREEMVPRGLEPRTLRLLAVRSNQLSYETNDFDPVDVHALQVTNAQALLTFCVEANGPPVGFEPTTSRLLSGCSAS